jgi:predicted amidophosphoribosyltransferase
MNAMREISVSGGLVVRRVIRGTLTVLFPPLCMSCRARISEPHSLCAECWAAISFIEEPICAACGAPFDIDPGGETICGACHAKPRDFSRARSLLRYDEASNP